MIIIQHILLQWQKDCRGGKGAVQRSRYPLAAKLPKDFFKDIPFGSPVHWQWVEQKPDGFHRRTDRRGLEIFDAQHSLPLGPMEIILNTDGGCLLRYRYDWHKGAVPPRQVYDPKTSQYRPLSEQAFVLEEGDYGRALCNGRFVDRDTGSWWYELSITNVLLLPQESAPLDCFLTADPTHLYRQIAQLR